MEKYISLIFSYIWLFCVGSAIGNNTIPNPKVHTMASIMFGLFTLFCLLAIIDVIILVGESKRWENQ